MRVGDLDVEPVDAVVLDLEAGNPGARALARFEIDQESPAVLVDRAKLVQLGIVATRDDVAVTEHCGGLSGDGAHE